MPCNMNVNIICKGRLNVRMIIPLPLVVFVGISEGIDGNEANFII